jgi:hypothetical protein
MSPPRRCRGRRQHTPARRSAPSPAALAALAAALGCAALSGAPAPAELPDEPPAAGLRVRLAFPADADLDLHVTDPLHETVYFANTPSASGGQLARDARCGDPAPRVETVVFDDPPPGRYRIGIDFPIRCRRLGEPVPFALEVSARGRAEERRGEIPFGRFEPIVWEFEVR